MFGLGGVLQGMAMLEDARDTAGSGAKDGRIGVAEICIEASLICMVLGESAGGLQATYIA